MALSKVVVLVVSIAVAVACVVYLNSHLQLVWVPIAIALLPCSLIMIAKSLTDDERVQTQFQQLETEAQQLLKGTKSLEAKLMSTENVVHGLQRSCDAIKSKLSDMEKVPDLSDLVDEFEKATRDRLKGLTIELHSRNFTLMWNSLPFSEKFKDFDDRTKVLYFDAITKGDWSKINARLRK